jgi:uncharacterized protein YkwD
MWFVAPPPQVRTVAVRRLAVFTTHCTVLLGAVLLPSACFVGLPDGEEPQPWQTAGESSDDDGGGDDGDADDGGDSANDDAGSAADGGSAADDGSASAADGGSADTAADDGSATADEGGSADEGPVDTSADGGSADDGPVDTGADDSSADGGSADDGGTSDEVPDNAFCMGVAGSDAAWSTMEEEILVIVNQRRAEGANCGSEGNFGPAGPLTMNPALRCAARVHSKQMVTEDFFDHTTPWGESPWDRMMAAGYSYSTAGENIAAGNSTAASTMQQWMDSDGHCSNIMNADFTEIGVGYYPGGGYGHYWTQNFGTP